MSRTLLALLLFALFGIAATLFFEQDNGYVLLRYGDLVVETSIVFFIVALVVGLSLLAIGLRAFRIGLGIPRWLPEMVQRQRSRSAQRSLLRGLVMFLEGHWATAEKELARRSGSGDARLVNYLHAAIAAQRQGSTERRDYYLQQAAQADDNTAELAILLTQARLQQEAGQETQAIASLDLLLEKFPNHAVAQADLLRACASLEDWARVRELWPDCRRKKLLPDGELMRLGETAYGSLLDERASKGLDALDGCWQSLPRSMRMHEPLLLRYSQHLLQDPAGHAEAQRLILASLKQRWLPELALLYAELDADDLTAQLATVEAWIKQHGEQPELQLLAGRLCLRNKLWGRARSYLQAVIDRDGDPRAWLSMGDLNEQNEDAQSAAQAYAEGLRQALKSE